MKIIEVSDDSIVSKIEYYLSRDFNVLVLSGSKHCNNCHESSKIIESFESEKLILLTLDNTMNDYIESNYWEIYELSEYPKSICFKDNMQTYFVHGGIITETFLKKCEKS